MAKPVLQILCDSNTHALFTLLVSKRQALITSFFNTLEKTTLIIKYGGRQNATMASMTTKHENSSVLELEHSKSKPPKLYKVILLNDDFTTMEFVIEVLQTFFAKTQEQATQIMLKIHHEGSAVCGVYTKDIAETKVVQVSEFSTQHGHPLRCHMEEN
jgi:ATP-dependent Clp protease adaptor protein ClpS